MDKELSDNPVWIAIIIIIALPIITSILLLIGSREGWFGRGEKSKKIDRTLLKLWKPIILALGIGGGNGLVEAALDKTEISYTCKYCKHKSHQNFEFCPQCRKDDYGNRSDHCANCNKLSNSKYNFCPYCGNGKPHGKV